MVQVISRQSFWLYLLSKPRSCRFRREFNYFRVVYKIRETRPQRQRAINLPNRLLRSKSAFEINLLRNCEFIFFYSNSYNLLRILVGRTQKSGHRKNIKTKNFVSQMIYTAPCHLCYYQKLQCPGRHRNFLVYSIYFTFDYKPLKNQCSFAV